MGNEMSKLQVHCATADGAATVITIPDSSPKVS